MAMAADQPRVMVSVEREAEEWMGILRVLIHYYPVMTGAEQHVVWHFMSDVKEEMRDVAFTMKQDLDREEGK
jgi:hypothetical protein